MEPLWLEIAWQESLSGVCELAGPQENAARIIEYHSATTLRATTDEVAWCSSLVNWCLLQAGQDITRSAAARSWLSWGLDLRVPAIGCVAVLKRAGKSQPGPAVLDAPGHVGFYFGRGSQSEVLILGGNQDNAVNVRAYPLARVLGYRWPV